MKRAEIERKFDEIVDFAEVEKFMETPMKHYSSGMYVRLAFSVAAHRSTGGSAGSPVAHGDARSRRDYVGRRRARVKLIPGG